jgi:Late competence development protein ComFB
VPARYIRHSVDLLFYLTDREREEFDRSVHEAVKHAFEFVQARSAMRARA